jgi:hypothetical protein
MEVSGQPHAPITLPLRKKSLILNRKPQPKRKFGCCGEERNLYLCWELNSSPSVVQLIA